MSGVCQISYRGWYGGAARYNNAQQAALRQSLHMLLQRSGVKRVEILGFGLAEYLYPIGMDEIEVANHPLRRLRDGLIIEMTATPISTGVPGQTQLLPFVLKQLCSVDSRHLGGLPSKLTREKKIDHCPDRQ